MSPATEPKQLMTPSGIPIQLPALPIPANDGMASNTVRTEPELSPARAELVKKWTDTITNAKTHWANDFKRMKDNMRFSGGDQWDGADPNSDSYVANITQRHLQQRVAALYAKNPKVVCRRAKKMDFAEWDGSFKSLGLQQQRLQENMTTGIPMDPNQAAFIQDFIRGTQHRLQMQKIAKTMELLFEHTLAAQEPPFKISAKQLVRRTLTTGVGYVKIGFRRTLQKRPEDVEQVNMLTERVRNAERIMADRVDDITTDDSPDLEVLRQQLQSAQEAMQDKVAEEGVVFDFPRSTSIIIDKSCTHLRTFTGAKWIAHEYVLTREDIQEIYGIDVKAAQSNDGVTAAVEDANKGFTVWEVYEKKTGHVFTLMQGYPDYLREPAVPDFHLSRFWPVIPLCFNEMEAEGDKLNSIYPISDVELVKHIQKEYNRSREALRRHRIANRPRHATPAGALDEQDKNNLQASGGNTTIELSGMQPGEDITKKLMPIPVVPLDPQVYNTDMLFSDMLRVVGSQEADLGGTSNATATESSISASSRASSLASNIDDLDDVLTDLARSCGQVFLLEMSEETVKDIVGPGAVWPDLTRAEVAKELSLEIQAGSSGRPNRAAEIANFERLMPFFIQIPGVNPEWVAREAITRLDDRLEFEDCWIGNVPSMMAMNANAQPPTGNPATNPSAQGPQGARNAPAAPANQPPAPPLQQPPMAQ